MDFISSSLNEKDENGEYPFSKVYVDEKQTFGDKFPKSWIVMKQNNRKDRKTGKEYTQVLAYPESTYNLMKKMHMLPTLNSIPRTPLLIDKNLSVTDLTGKILTLKANKYKIGFQHTSRAQGVNLNWTFDAFQIEVDGDGYDVK